MKHGELTMFWSGGVGKVGFLSVHAGRVWHSLNPKPQLIEMCHVTSASMTPEARLRLSPYFPPIFFLECDAAFGYPKALRVSD